MPNDNPSAGGPTGADDPTDPRLVVAAARINRPGWRWWPTLVVVAGVGLFAVTGPANEEPRRDAKPAPEETATADPARLEYAHEIYRAHAEYRNGNVARAVALLQSCRAELRGWEWHYVRRLCHPELFSLPRANPERSGRLVQGSAAYSPDGRFILTANGDKTASVRDARTGNVVLTLTEEGHNLHHASYNHDGTRIVATGLESSASVWEVPSAKPEGVAKTGKKLLTLTRDRRAIAYGCFSPDGKRIVTSGNRDLTVWDAETGKEVLTFATFALTYSRPSYSPDGKRILADGMGGAGVWDAQTGEKAFTVKGGGKGAVHIARFSPDGTRIVASDYDGTALVYDAQTGKEVLALKGHSDSVKTSAFSPDGSRIVTASPDRTLRVWDAKSGRELTAWKSADAINDAVFSPDGSRLLTIEPRAVKVWDATAPAEQVISIPDGSFIVDACFSPDGKRVAAGGNVGHRFTVGVFDAATGKSVLTLPEHDYVVHAVGYSPDGKRILTRTGTARTKLWDAETGEMRFDLGDTGFGSLNIQAQFRDPSRLITLRKGQAQVWDTTTGKKLHDLAAKREIASAWGSPDGANVVTLTRGGELMTWDAKTGKEVRTLALQAPPEAIERAWPSPDGLQIVAADRAGSARCWSAKTGKPLYSLPGMTLIDDRQLRFSPDGSRIVTTASGDATVHVWDAVGGRELLAITGHTKPVACVSFSADGARILSAQYEGPIRLHDGRPVSEKGN